MTMREEIIYEKLITYSTQRQRDDTVYIDNEFGASIVRAQMELNALDLYKENPFYRPLEGNSGFIGKFKVFIKRVIRKINVFYAKPVCDQQTSFNCAVFKSSYELLTGEKIINNELVSLMGEVSDLKKELSKCKKELKELKNCLSVSGDKTER